MDEAIPQDDLVMIEPEDCDYYQLPEGVLLIGRSDTFVSQGFVDLLPGKSLPPRARPAAGSFKQMAGTSVFRVHDGDQIKEEKTLQTGDRVSVPVNTSYSFENASGEKCVVYWRFDGDVHEAFEKLRKDLPVVQIEAREKSGYKNLFEEYQKRMEEKQGDR